MQPITSKKKEKDLKDMIKNPMIIHTAMMEAVEQAYEKGNITIQDNEDLSPDLLFPFPLGDVAGLHTDENGGFLFELCNGEVWKASGERIQHRLDRVDD